MTTTIQKYSKYQYAIYMLVNGEDKHFEYICCEDYNIKTLAEQMRFWKNPNNIYKLEVSEFCPETFDRKVIFSCDVVYSKPNKTMLDSLNPEKDMVLDYKLHKVWPQKTGRVPMQLLKYSNKSIKIQTEVKPNLIQRLKNYMQNSK